MNVNIESLQIYANHEFARFTIQMQVPSDDDLQHYHLWSFQEASTEELQARQKREFLRSFVISHAEVRHVLAIINNSASYAPYFDDGIHLVKFHPHGIREYYVSGERNMRQFWLEFPLVELRGPLELLLTYTEQQQDYILVADFQAADCAEWAAQYGPKYKWQYENYYDDAPDLRAKIQVDNADPRVTGSLRESLERLTNIACNYSDGQENTIILRYDARPRPDQPASYYFCIMTPDNKRIMNGGIIAHPRFADKWGEGEPVGWEYSTHT